MTLTRIPDGWNANDLQRFNDLIDTCLAYMIFDYARKAVAPNDVFLQERQVDVGGLVKSLGQQFEQQWNQ